MIKNKKIIFVKAIFLFENPIPVTTYYLICIFFSIPCIPLVTYYLICIIKNYLLSSNHLISLAIRTKQSIYVYLCGCESKSNLTIDQK